MKSRFLPAGWSAFVVSLCGLAAEGGGPMHFGPTPEQIAAQKAAAEAARATEAQNKAAQHKAEAEKQAAQAKEQLAAARKAAIAGGVPDSLKAAGAAQRAAAAARAASQAAAALYSQAGAPCAGGAAIRHVQAASAAADAAEQDALRAREVALAVEEAAKTLPLQAKYADELKAMAESLVEHADMLGKRAPPALEAMGSFVGAPQKKFNDAAARIRDLAKQSLQVVQSIGPGRIESLTVKDDASLDHVVKLRKTIELGRQELDLPPDVEKEIDKELDNLSIKELGLKGSGEDPEKDEKNLEHPFEKVKDGIAVLSRKGGRYLKAAADVLVPKHASRGPKSIGKLQGFMTEMRSHLKAIVDVLVALQSGQAGEKGEEPPPEEGEAGGGEQSAKEEPAASAPPQQQETGEASAEEPPAEE